MEHSIVAAGRIADPRHIELDEPLHAIQGRVEIIVRPAPKSSELRVDIMDVILAMPPGSRSKEEIDQEIEAERSSWGD